VPTVSTETESSTLAVVSVFPASVFAAAAVAASAPSANAENTSSDANVTASSFRSATTCIHGCLGRENDASG
jgi:hypothetical protein